MIPEQPRHHPFARLTCALCIAAFAACGGDDGGGSEEDEVEPSKPRKPPPAEQIWSSEVIVDDNAGQYVSLHYDTAESRPVLAYYVTSATDDGPCEEIGGGMDVPTRKLWELIYGEERGAGWEFETVVETLSQSAPPGLGFTLGADGTPLIAAITGTPLDAPRYCGAHDVGLFTRTAPGNWSAQTMVSTSGEAASGEPASDAGVVIGYWPAIAIDGSGNPAIAYQDVHFGGIQNDDFERADLEISLAGTPLPVDVGTGGGRFSRLLFDPERRPTIVHYNPVMQELVDRVGLWVTRSGDGGATWDEVRLFSSPLVNAPDAIFDADGQLVVAYYDPGRGVPVLVTLTDDSMFTSFNDGWEQETIGDPRYDEGYDPSLALDDDGTLGLAYYRCGREVDNCNFQEDGLVMLHRAAGQTEFVVETVDEGNDLDACGRFPSLIFEAAGRPTIAYACIGGDSDMLVDQVRLARREAL